MIFYNLPIELNELIYEYLYDFDEYKRRVIKELNSFLILNRQKNIFENDSDLKPSSINGTYKISYAS